MIEGAPKLVDFIADDVARALRGAARCCSATPASPTTINPRLVRGLDYYNRTVFEWVATSDELGAQGTVAGGGRYDALFELLGGKRNFACGFAIGIERMILLLAAAGVNRAAAPLAYVVHDGADAARARAQRRRAPARRRHERSSSTRAAAA